MQINIQKYSLFFFLVVVYDVAEIKPEVTILGPADAAQAVTSDTQPELFTHLHINDQELQTRIMHM